MGICCNTGSSVRCSATAETGWMGWEVGAKLVRQGTSVSLQMIHAGAEKPRQLLQSNYPPIKINTLETNKMPTWKLVSLTDAQKLASPSLLSKDTLSGPANKNEPIGNNSYVIWGSFSSANENCVYHHHWCLEFNEIYLGRSLRLPKLRNQMKWVFFHKSWWYQYVYTVQYVRKTSSILSFQMTWSGKNVSCRAISRYSLIFVKINQNQKDTQTQQCWSCLGACLEMEMLGSHPRHSQILHVTKCTGETSARKSLTGTAVSFSIYVATHKPLSLYFFLSSHLCRHLLGYTRNTYMSRNVNTKMGLELHAWTHSGQYWEGECGGEGEGVENSRGTFTFYHAAFWTVCLSYRENLLMSYLGGLNVNTKVV